MVKGNLFKGCRYTHDSCSKFIISESGDSIDIEDLQGAVLYGERWTLVDNLIFDSRKDLQLECISAEQLVFFSVIGLTEICDVNISVNSYKDVMKAVEPYSMNLIENHSYRFIRQAIDKVGNTIEYFVEKKDCNKTSVVFRQGDTSVLIYNEGHKVTYEFLPGMFRPHNPATATFVCTAVKDNCYVFKTKSSIDVVDSDAKYERLKSVLFSYFGIDRVNLMLLGYISDFMSVKDFSEIGLKNIVYALCSKAEDILNNKNATYLEQGFVSILFGIDRYHVLDAYMSTCNKADICIDINWQECTVKLLVNKIPVHELINVLVNGN